MEKTIRHPARYSVRDLGDGKVLVRYAVCGEMVERTWRVVGQERGYVYDVTDRPGTLGQQVVSGDDGSTMHCSREALPREARRLLRRWADRDDRENSNW